MTKRATKSERDFLLGFAAALGALAREYGYPSLAISIMNDSGVTLAMLRAAKVDAFDLNPLAKEWRQR